MFDVNKIITIKDGPDKEIHDKLKMSSVFGKNPFSDALTSFEDNKSD